MAKAKTKVAEKLGQFGHHPDQTIDAEVEVERLRGLLEEARCGLKVALNFQAAPPHGLAIKNEVRRVLVNVGWDETAPAYPEAR